MSSFHISSRCFLAVGAIVVSPTHHASQPSATDTAIRTAMAKWHSPGAAVAVVRNGRVVFAQGYGLADRERGVPVTPDTRFYIGSVSKQFTAAAALMLVQEGKISLDDKAIAHLAKLPNAYADITVRHLLNHTSGIQRDFRTHGRSFIGDTLYEAMAAVPLAFAPGQQAGYSNTEYILLGMMVEAVSGLSFGDFLSSRIFRPLGMSATTYMLPGEKAKNVAVGYERMGDTLQPVDVVAVRYGAGAIISTVRDLAKWDAALSTDVLLKRPARDAMWTPAMLRDGTLAVIGADDAGRLLASGMGWHISTHFGHRVIHHGGNIDGYSAQIDRFVDDSTTIIVLANNEAHAAINIARPLIEHYVQRLEYASPGSLIQLGRLAYDAGDFAEAAKRYTAALEKGDTTPTTAFNAARAFAQLGQKDQSFAMLTRALALGYRDVARLNSETSLETIRSDSRWTGIVERAGRPR